MRPDGRVFVRAPDDVGDYAFVRDADVERWLAHGFAVHRREIEYVVPTVPPEPHPFLHLDDVDLDGLRLLDEELRQDVPGADGWRWTADAFRAETYSSPSVYLVAPEYAGICRVWLREPTPRLGFIGVVRAALGETHALGFAEVTTEIDETNAASQALFRGFGARPIGGYVELMRSESTDA